MFAFEMVVLTSAGCVNVNWSCPLETLHPQEFSGIAKRLHRVFIGYILVEIINLYESFAITKN